jgi:hypothetical protein
VRVCVCERVCYVAFTGVTVEIVEFDRFGTHRAFAVDIFDHHTAFASVVCLKHTEQLL